MAIAYPFLFHIETSSYTAHDAGFFPGVKSDWVLGGVLTKKHGGSVIRSLLALAGLTVVIFHQACNKHVSLEWTGPSSRLENGNGGYYGGMQELKFARYSSYSPTLSLTGISYYRMIPGGMCGGHAGHIFEESGVLKYENSACSTSSQTLSSVPLAPYNPRYLAFQNGIFEAFAAAPDLSSLRAYNKIFCRGSDNLTEGLDVVIQRDASNSADTIIASSDLMRSPWGQTNDATVSLAQEPMPDGESPVYRVTENTLLDYHQALSERIPGLPDNSIYTISVFAKSEGRSISLNMRRKDGQYVSCGVNLLTGVQQGCSTANIVASGIVPYPDGWYWVWVSYNVLAGTFDPHFYFELDLHTAGTARYQGDGTSGILLARPRVERGSSPAPVGAMAAAIFIGEQNSSSFQSSQVAPFSVRESLLDSARAIGSDTYKFSLEIQSRDVGIVTPARLQTTISGTAIDMNLDCLVEPN